eukprot:6850089-Ditylum_brightwellii.AAC.1
MQILSIYVVDYSIFISLMWKALLSSSKKHGTLNRGLHGGRQDHDTQTLSLIEELKYDICYCSRKLLINFDNNAASCYDWILPNVYSLLARKKDLHKNVTFIHAQAQKEAKYRLKTALGVSNKYYQHCTIFSIYSSGRGATNSP